MPDWHLGRTSVISDPGREKDLTHYGGEILDDGIEKGHVKLDRSTA